MEAKADDHLSLMGWRGADAARLNGVGGRACRRAAQACGGLYQQRRQRARLSLRRGLAFAGAAGERSRAVDRRSGDRGFGVAASAGFRAASWITRAAKGSEQ